MSAILDVRIKKFHLHVCCSVLSTELYTREETSEKKYKKKKRQLQRFGCVIGEPGFHVSQFSPRSE